MATIHAQPPESGLDAHQSTPIIPRRRTVIDVDEFVETRAAQRRRIDPEIISLLDSDEDEPEHGNSARRSIHEGGQRRPSRRSIFSPPPPAMPGGPLPPVPPIPAQYAEHTGYPVRPRAGRHAPPTPPAGVVRPIAQPLPFETVLQRYNRQRARQQRQQNQLNQIRQRGIAPFAAPPSHHTPNMGLGGALIAHNQRLTREERIRNQIRSATAFLFANEPVGGDEQWRPPAVIQHFPNPMGQSEDAYQRWYTHGHAPEPGFTFDFAPEETPATGPSANVIVIDDEMLESPGAGPSSHPANNTTMSTLLVCARCLDPLVLGEGGARKVWGLRCGHLLDGKCLDIISKVEEPAVAPEPSDTKGSNKGKGKGKGKAVESPPQLITTFDLASAPGIQDLVHLACLLSLSHPYQSRRLLLTLSVNGNVPSINVDACTSRSGRGANGRFGGMVLG
ncbi:hypothetical protein BD779DRAFT_505188 [Infundibulicybe gibba]|nr:hypothetical protein BD779DRAFT_505188 [Infundibulicybe gibba]